jgi:hypothetical protein
MKKSQLQQIIKEEIAKSLNEASLFQKMLRKAGWAGESWTPQEIASQIKKLPNETLILWSKDSNGIPGTPLYFQQKLVKIEMDKRGLKEEIQNTLTEAIMIGWNGYEQKPIKIEPTREKDGINITNEDNPGQMWFVPSDQIPELVGYLQGLNLKSFTTGDAELNPSLVKMVKRMGRR